MNNEYNNGDLIINRRQLSFVCATVIFLLFISFISGYMLRIYIMSQKEYVIPNVSFVHNDDDESTEYAIGYEIQDEDIGDASGKALYYAELIGFGTQKAAQSFVNDLGEKGFPLILNERTSHTSKGKEIVWYQVVTDQYDKKDELTSVVNDIRRYKTLHDVRFVTLQG